jgi:hypothetical protein
MDEVMCHRARHIHNIDDGHDAFPYFYRLRPANSDTPDAHWPCHATLVEAGTIAERCFDQASCRVGRGPDGHVR